MKTFKNTLGFKYLFLFVVIAVAALSSCKKDNSVSADTSAKGSAFLMITNAADGSASQDLLIDNVKLSGSTVAYTQSTGYIAVPAGDHSAQFVTTGTTTVNSSTTLSLQAGQYYSVYYSGSSTSSASSSSSDDLSAPSSGKAKVRFVNLSAALTGAVDFGTSATNKLATNLAAKVASAYYTVDAATTFNVYLAGSSTASLAIPATIQAGKIYTIYISGATTATLTYKVVAQN